MSNGRHAPEAEPRPAAKFFVNAVGDRCKVGMLTRLLCLPLLVASSVAAKPATPPPRLAVLISLDQFRADYLDRFRPYFTDGGFVRLLDGGAVYAECHHRHAVTSTAPGHATLATGVFANTHGIIANEWLDPQTLVLTHSVSDPAAALVGDRAGTGGKPADGVSPRLLRATTIGDQMKLRWGSRTHVISLSNKPRAAVMMGGHLADGVYWEHGGRMVTSRFYRATLPEWVTAFNATDRVDAAFGQTWTRLLAPEIYDRVQGPDNAPGEENADGMGVTFPHRIDGGARTIGPNFYDAFLVSPFATELLEQFAEAAVRGEQLGRHEVPDLLCVSFSQTDYCGHSYGPDSHEQMDTIVRLDRVLAKFFAFLDAEVGAGNYTIVLSSDHGVCPLPERVAGFGRGVAAGRFDAGAAARAIESALTAEFGPSGDVSWAVRDGSLYRLRPAVVAAKHVDRARAAVVMKRALAALPQIAAVYTRAELLAAAPQGDGVLAAERRSFNADRSGDVMYVVHTYVVDRPGAGTNHGQPYDYDSHVPLVWYGAGVTPGVHLERVGTDQLAPTLCALVGVPRPPQAEGQRLF